MNDDHDAQPSTEAVTAPQPLPYHVFQISKAEWLYVVWSRFLTDDAISYIVFKGPVPPPRGRPLYTPMQDHWRTCTVQNGSSWDLTGWEPHLGPRTAHFCLVELVAPSDSPGAPNYAFCADIPLNNHLLYAGQLGVVQSDIAIELDATAVPPDDVQAPAGSIG